MDTAVSYFAFLAWYEALMEAGNRAKVKMTLAQAETAGFFILKTFFDSFYNMQRFVDHHFVDQT